MIKKTLLAAVLAGIAGVAAAAPVTLTVDPTHTYEQYEIGHMGFSMQTGAFTKTSGTIVVDEAAKTGTVDITIDANSLQTYFAARDSHLKSKEFFNVASFPTMTFKSNNLVFQGDKLAEVKGDLTILGVSKPVTLKVTHFHSGPSPMTKKLTYGVNAETTINRSDFGMKAYLPGISDQVKLTVVIEAFQAN